MEGGRQISRLTLLRQLVATGLGSAVIVDALVSPASTAQWVAGLILLGIIPVDGLLAHRRGEDRG